jgi:hypothetical protein
VVRGETGLSGAGERLMATDAYLHLAD